MEKKHEHEQKHGGEITDEELQLSERTAQEIPVEQPAVQSAPNETVEDEVSEEEEVKERLPFPTAAVIRLMRKNLDREKIIKKEVKIAMNKWLGDMCEKVARKMNQTPYVTLHLRELDDGTAMYRKIEEFHREKERLLAHLDAMKKDIEKLERDLGKTEEEVIVLSKGV